MDESTPLPAAARRLAKADRQTQNQASMSRRLHTRPDVGGVNDYVDEGDRMRIGLRQESIVSPADAPERLRSGSRA